MRSHIVWSGCLVAAAVGCGGQGAAHTESAPAYLADGGPQGEGDAAQPVIPEATSCTPSAGTLVSLTLGTVASLVEDGDAVAWALEDGSIARAAPGSRAQRLNGMTHAPLAAGPRGLYWRDATTEKLVVLPEGALVPEVTSTRISDMFVVDAEQVYSVDGATIMAMPFAGTPRVLARLDEEPPLGHLQGDASSIYVTSRTGYLYVVSKTTGAVARRMNPGFSVANVAAPNAYWINPMADLEQTRLDGTGTSVTLGNFASGAGPGHKLSGLPAIAARGLFIAATFAGFEAPPAACGGEVLRVTPSGAEKVVTNLFTSVAVFGGRALYFTNGASILRLE